MKTKQEKIDVIYKKVANKELSFVVMIGDVLDYAGIINLIGDGRSEIVNILMCAWENKRLPIEEQSEECIDYVYNLMN